MLMRPEVLDNRAPWRILLSSGPCEPPPPRGPARRGASLPPHERRLLLPLRAHRALGPDAAAPTGLPLVPRGYLGRDVARGWRGGRDHAPARGPRAGHAWSRASAVERARGAHARDPRARPGGGLRPV